VCLGCYCWSVSCNVSKAGLQLHRKCTVNKCPQGVTVLPLAICSVPYKLTPERFSYKMSIVTHTIVTHTISPHLGNWFRIDHNPDIVGMDNYNRPLLSINTRSLKSTVLNPRSSTVSSASARTSRKRLFQLQDCFLGLNTSLTQNTVYLMTNNNGEK